jgi:hypothetical protein
MQTAEDVVLIKELVLEYMKNPRTIILAVITAKNDYANQIIIKHCKDIDPHGRRIMGIITKPDDLTEGSKNQQNWINLAQNKDVYFELGWHMVKNRSENEGDLTILQRNINERQFFSRGRYTDLPNTCKGIETLRTRLSNVLHNHLKTELPQLRAELQDKLQKTDKELEMLGVKRSTVLEQRMFLTDIGQKINEIIKSAIRGHYEYDFFGSVDMKAAVDSMENIRRFRAVIQHSNLKFSDQMHHTGHKFSIPTRKGNDPKAHNVAANYEKWQRENPKDAEILPKPIKMSRDEGINWVHHVLERSRGLELPGNFNPLIISQLFWEQSTHWNEIALCHIEKVSNNCKAFVDIVLEDAAPKDIKSRLSDLQVDGALALSLEGAKDELKKIIEDKSRHPMTYNHYFTTKIQDQRKSKFAQILSNVAKAAQVSLSTAGNENTQTYIDPLKLKNGMDGGIEQDMDKFSAEDALDSEIAYYTDELKYFIDCVTKQVR